MTVKKFLTKFVNPDSLIRLWVETKDKLGHLCLETEHGPYVGVVHEILRGEGAYAKYANCKILEITDILCEDYSEAINLVIQR